MTIEEFEKIANQIGQLKRTGVDFQVSIKQERDYNTGLYNVAWEPTNYSLDSFKQLSELQTVLNRPVALNDYGTKVSIKNKLGTGTGVMNAQNIIEQIRTNPAKRLDYPTLKFYSPTIRNTLNNFNVSMITETPPEEVEDEVTYRYIGDKNTCYYCVPHTHDLYNYLDRGFFYSQVWTGNYKAKMVITNELTVDTILCLIMLFYQPTYTKHLQQGVYLNANLAKVVRIKMEKEFNTLDQWTTRGYTQLRETLLREYEKTANAGLIDKLLSGKIPSGSFNEMKLTQDSATYETVVIQAPGLLKTLSDVIAFDDRTDIYVLINSYITLQLNQLENVVWKKEGDEGFEVGVEQTAERTFNVNGIAVTLKRTSANTRRYVNNILINKEEVQDVCFRSSCFTDQETFDKFVTSVKNMSLKWHDAIANGVGIKIHDGMSNAEITSQTAPLSAPKLKFRIKEGDVHLIINETKSSKIKLNDILKKIILINRKTNDGVELSSGYVRRNVAWARREIIKAMKECCTFDKKVLVTEEKEGKQVPVLDVLGKKQYTKEKFCTLADDDAQFIEKIAREYHQKALEKSKLFLESAVKASGAVLENFMGEPHYVVQGTLHKYAVNQRTNEVMNYELKKRICIVEPGHQVSVGGDATAARLFALKNDQRLVGSISTLRAG